MGILVGSSHSLDLAQLTDGHERAEQQVSHSRATRGLQVVHEGKAALANGGVDRKRHDDCDKEKDIVEGLVVELVRARAVSHVHELVPLLVEEALVQLDVREGDE